MTSPSPRGAPPVRFRDPSLSEIGDGHADFCPKCGQATRIESWQEGFMSSTGWPEIRYRTVCPNRHHWWDGHHRSIVLWADYPSRPPND